MNVRFAEPCREKPLEFLSSEFPIQVDSANDGRTAQERARTCQKDIYLGVFFDGTNNNKYRDSLSFGHSNVARLYEVYPGTPAAQTPPKFLPRVIPDSKGKMQKEERAIFADEAFAPSSVPPADFPYYRKIYVAGVGTPHPDVGDSGTEIQKTLGLSMALLGEARLDWAMLQICNQIHAAVFGKPIEASVSIANLMEKKPQERTIPLVLPVLPLLAPLEVQARKAVQKEWDKFSVTSGMAQGAFDALLTSYEKRLGEALNKRKQYNIQPSLRKIRLSVFGFSRGSAEARAFVNRVTQRWGNTLQGIALQIDFLGIFDTVASVGVAQSVPLANGHFAWADGNSMVVPDSVKRCVHLVSAFEVRGSFPLDSICQDGSLPSNCKEIVYPGVHSDVGGGYPPGDQGRSLGDGAEGDCRKLSQITLAQMYREARMAGVPLAPESSMKGYRLENFKIAPELLKDFNAYVEATRTGRVPPTDGKGDKDFARMFPTETQPRGSLIAIMRQHYGYLLQWRKKIRVAPGGAAGLPGLKKNHNDSWRQDIEDIRGAEAELMKELYFLLSDDPKKYEVTDDLFLETIQHYTSAAISALPSLGSMGAGLATFATVADWKKKDLIKACMHDKQQQWDSWLKEVWYGRGALPVEKAGAAHQLFENYVHDSRAWFKAFMRTDGRGMTPDDESWFTLGGREAEKAARVKELNQAALTHLENGQDKKRKEIEKQISELNQDGMPLVYGGREPYRMWGYLRHRRIYQSGKLSTTNAANHKKLEDTISKEELQRLREEIRNDRTAAENDRHASALAKIHEDEHRVYQSGRPSPGQTRSAMDAEERDTARQLIADEKKRHSEYLAQIDRDATKPL